MSHIYYDFLKEKFCSGKYESSWNNIAFRVKKSMENIVLADYLFLHFKRDEWDREACFQSCNRAGVSYT